MAPALPSALWHHGPEIIFRINSNDQIDRLLGIMKRLRDPENGCPWDKSRLFATIAPYTWKRPMKVLDAISGRFRRSAR